MKQKSFWLRMVPVVVLVVVTVFLSLEVYTQMIKTEEEVCWQRLEIATNSTADKIETRINDNMNFLMAVSDAYIFSHNMDNVAAIGEYLDSVMEQTIFEQIDVILPDNSMITHEGEIKERGGKSSYEELVQRGTHISQRVTSSFTGQEVICCVTPIEENGETLGLLVGTISCQTMSELFEVFTYGQEAQLFLIDRANGDYLMDNWHDQLGNIYDLGPRESADGGEMVDMVPIIMNGGQERLVYISQTNGITAFQYCTPIDKFNWEVCVAVQEDVVFANVKKLEEKLYNVGLAELLVVLIYVLWNICMNIMAVRSEQKVRNLEYEKAKNEARGKFISNMSHDVKTPLNGIVGMLQIIKNHRNEPEVVDDCLQKIEISANYLSTLASDMLDISEIENNKLVLQEDVVDLHKLTDELTVMMERQAKEADVTYSFDSSDLSHPYIVGSSVHIKRILVNLISNAIKYSKHAGKHVWVTIYDEPLEHDIAQKTTEKRMYRFIIKDNGIGMSEEFQKNMYQAFEQEIIDARSEYQGYGLGLTIVNHLIRKMNGTIELESTKDVGSTFTVSIPFIVDEKNNAVHETDNQEQQGDEEQTLDISGLRILLVEDNEFNMEIANVLLTDAGALVDMAVNGKEAVEVFAASKPHTYDAVIMDVMMPVMDGYEATKEIRAMNRIDALSVPIIAMTANTFAEDIAHCKEVGMNAHIPKPLDVKELMTTIMQFCK